MEIRFFMCWLRKMLKKHQQGIILCGPDAPAWAEHEDASARHCVREAYFIFIGKGIDVASLKKEIADTFLYTRSTCDDERELLSVAQRQKASGKDR